VIPEPQTWSLILMGVVGSAGLVARKGRRNQIFG